ncbi:MAG: ArnT family glycosyltransferase [Isosphaeraceae bacterium]
MFVGLMLCFIALQCRHISDDCLTIDENAHLASGVSHWERGFFSLYQENPPLARCLVSLPVWLSSPRTNYSGELITPGRRSEWLVGRDFVYANIDHYFDYLFRARCVSVAFGAACGTLVYLWTSQLFGRAAALVVATLWLLDPGVLAHSGLATVDAGSTFFGLGATYLFWRWMRWPTWVGAGLVGLALGLALGSKFSMLALGPSWAIMAGLALTQRSRTAGPSQSPGRRDWLAAQLLLILSFALVVLNCCYGFEGTFTRLGDYRFVSVFLGGGAHCGEGDATLIPCVLNRFRGSAFHNLPVPLPAPYLQGFDSQKREEELGLVRICDGRLTREGDLLGPLRTLTRKLPPGTLILLGSCILLAFFRFPGEDLRALLVVAATGVVLLVLLSMQTGLNWAFRYSLPALPYLFVASGSPIRAAWGSRPWRSLVIFCLAWNAYELFAVAPYYLSYANPVVGGTERAHRYLLGSNYDWGQDILRLKRWADKHPQAKPLVFTCYNAVEPEVVGLSLTALPKGPPGYGRRAGTSNPFQPYYLAVSTNILHGLALPIPQEGGAPVFGSLTSRRGWDGLEPFARPAPSILVYYIVNDDYDVYIDPRGVSPRDGATP